MKFKKCTEIFWLQYSNGIDDFDVAYKYIIVINQYGIYDQFELTRD